MVQVRNSIPPTGGPDDSLENEDKGPTKFDILLIIIFLIFK